METLSESQTNYRPETKIYPSYRLSKVLPLSGSTRVGVNASTQEVFFEIPTKVFNLSESTLTFTRYVAAQAAYSWVFADTFGEILQLQLYTRSGKMLADINNFNNYMKVARKLWTPYSELVSQDRKSGLYPSNQVPAAGQRHDNTASNVAIYEPKYLNVSGNAAEYKESVQLKFCDIPDSIFSMNKDMMFPEIIILKVIFCNKVGYAGTSPVDPTLAPTALVAANIVDLNGTYTNGASNLSLYLAVEQNPKIVSDVTNASAMKLYIPYVHSYKTNLSGDSQTVSIRLNSGHGVVCKRIIHSIFNNFETTNTAYDHSNIPATGATGTADKVTNYYTMLNNDRRQEFTPLCTQDAGDDYLLHSHVLRNSILCNNNVYSYNWFHLESFDNERNAKERKDNPNNTNNVDGLNIVSAEQKWDFYASLMASNVARNHYTFVICIREVSISPGNIDVK